MGNSHELQRAIREYIHRRSEEGRPDIREFAAEYSELQTELMLRLPCVEFELAWREAKPKGDNGPPLELVLKDFPELREAPDALLELISIEVEFQPSQPSEDNFIRRVPQIEPLIHSFFSLMRGQAPEEWESWTRSIRRGVEASHSGSPRRDAPEEPVAPTDPSTADAQQAPAKKEQEQPQTAFADGETVEITDQIQVVRYLEKGSSKWVFEGIQSSTGRPIALKQLQSLSKEQLSQFVSEGRAQGRLDHQNIPPVFVLAPENGDRSFLLEKLVSVPNWSESIRDREIPLERKLRTLLSVSRAAEYAHREHGIVHRDIKPQNVLIGDFGQVFLIDWGLAVRTRPDDTEDGPIRHVRDEDRGRGCGTPAYLPPESALGRWDDCSPATDVFLLGAMLYEMLSGKAPFDGYANTAWFRAATHTFNPLPDTTPAELVSITNRAMSQFPTDRYADAGEFGDAIEQFLEHLPAEQQTQQAAKNLAEVASEIEAARKSGSPMHPLVRRLISVADQFRQARETWQAAGSTGTDADGRTADERDAPRDADDNLFRSVGIDRTRNGERDARRLLVEVAAKSGDLTLAAAQVEELTSLSDAAEVLELSRTIDAKKRQRSLSRFLFASSVCAALVAAGWAWFSTLDAAEQRNQASEARADKATAETAQATAERDAANARIKQAEADRVNARDNLQRLIERDETIGTGEIANDRLPVAIAWFADAARQDQSGREKHNDWSLDETIAKQRVSSLVRDYPDLLTNIPDRRPIRRVEYSPATDRLLTIDGEGFGFRLSQWDAKTGQRLPLIIEIPSAMVSDSEPLTGTSMGGPVLVFSPDGRWIAMAINVLVGNPQAAVLGPPTGQLRIYNAESGEQVGDSVDLEGLPHSLVFNSDGTELASVTSTTSPLVMATSGQGAGVVQFWNVADDGQLARTTRVMRPGGMITRASFSADLKRLAIDRLSGGTIQLWDTVAAKDVTPEGVTNVKSAIDCVLTQDGKSVAIVWGKQIELHDFETGELIASPAGFSGSLGDSKLIAGPNSGLITVTQRDELGLTLSEGSATEARRWKLFKDSSGGRLSSSPSISDAEIRTVTLGPSSLDHPLIVTGDSEGVVRIRTVGSSLPVFPPLRHDGSIAFAELSSDGSRLVVVSTQGTITIWDLTRHGLGEPIPDSPVIATSSDFARQGPGSIQRRNDRDHLESAAQHVAISPDGRLIATLGYTVEEKVGADVETDRLREATAKLNEATDQDTQGTGVALPRDQALDELSLWDTATARRVLGPISLGADVEYGKFSSDGRYLMLCRSMLATGLGKSVMPGDISRKKRAARGQPPENEDRAHVTQSQIWCIDTETGRSILNGVARPGSLGDVLFLQKSGRLLVGGDGTETGNGALELWNVETGESLAAVTVSAPVAHIRCTADQSLILATLTTGQIQFWECIDDGLNPGSGLFDSGVGHADISHDGRYVVTSELHSNMISVWNHTNTASPEWTAQWHPGKISSLKFQPGQLRFATSDDRGRVGIWEVESKRREPQIQRDERAEVHNVAWSPDGRLFATLVSSGRSQVFDAESGRPVSSVHQPLVSALQGEVRFTADSQKLIVHEFSDIAHRSVGREWMRDLSIDARPLEDLIAAAERVSGYSVPTSPEQSGVSSATGLLDLRAVRTPEFIESEYQRHPDNDYLLLLKGRREAELGEHEHAVATFTRLIEQQEPTPSNEALLARATSYEQLRRAGLAATDRLRATNLKTADGTSLFSLAMTLYQSDPKRALPICDVLEQRGENPRSPQDPFLSFNGIGIRSLCRAQLGDYDTALTEMTRFRGHQFFPIMTAVQPGVIGLFDYNTLGMHLANGDDEAFRALSATLLADPALPTQPDRVLWLARGCRMEQEAVEDFASLAELTGTIVEQQQGNLDALAIHGTILYRAGRYDDARQILAAAMQQIDALPEDSAAVKDSRAVPPVWLALAQHKTGQTEEAKVTLQTGLDRIRRELAEEAINQAPHGTNWIKRLTLRLLLEETSRELGVDISFPEELTPR